MAQTVAESMASTSGADGESADIGDSLDFQAAIAQAFKDMPQPTEEMKVFK